jgi:hypothetical protein
MSWHPHNDRLKVRLNKTDPYKLGVDETQGIESGVVVEVPDVLIYLAFHSFAFEDSFVAEEKLKKIQEHYSSMLNKPVRWEAFQDRGRRVKEGDDEFVYLQMTDVLAVGDDESDLDAATANQKEIGRI